VLVRELVRARTWTWGFSVRWCVCYKLLTERHVRQYAPEVVQQHLLQMGAAASSYALQALHAANALLPTGHGACKGEGHCFQLAYELFLGVHVHHRHLCMYACVCVYVCVRMRVHARTCLRACV